MKRTRVAGLCVLAMFAFSAFVASSASAVIPEFGKCTKVATGTGKYKSAGCSVLAIETTEKKYNWEPGVPAGLGFTSKGGTGELLTVGGKTVTCETQSAVQGEYVSGTDNKHEDGIFVKFQGCKSKGQTCTTAGKNPGELETLELVGEVGYEKASSEKLTDLKLEPGPADGGFFIKFKCVSFEIQVRGGPNAKKNAGEGGKPGQGILVKIKNNKMAFKEILKYKQTAGKQKPLKWIGVEPETYLESSFEGLNFEQSGQTIESTVENNGAVKLELKAFKG